MRIEDISPIPGNTSLTSAGAGQCTSGRGLTIAGSRDGQRLYVGSNAGVWRSKNGGSTWKHLERPQPRPGTVAVPGALLAMNVYDLAVTDDADIVLACTNYDTRGQDGVYRSTDGGASWNRRLQFVGTPQSPIRTSQIITAPENAAILFLAAGGSSVRRSADRGDSWDLLTAVTETLFHVAAGPIAAANQEGTRRMYALGTNVWFSTDGGKNWNMDRTSNLTGAPPVDAGGPSTRLIAIHPGNPSILYGIRIVNNVGTVRRGDFSGATPTWTDLAPLPDHPDDTSGSGTAYVVAHLTSEKQLYLFVSDKSALWMSIGEPASKNSWNRLDTVKGAPLGSKHVDPHAVFVSKDFRHVDDGGGRGLIAQLNDGGVQISTDGTGNWSPGSGLTAFSLINVAVNAPSRKASPAGGRVPPKITFGTGDNGGFFSSDGGKTWITAEYQQGDNDACFSDPRSPSLLFVFAPREVKTSLKQLVVYRTASGNAPDAGSTTQQAVHVPGPFVGAEPIHKLGWNCVSDYAEIGYRPLVLTLSGEKPEPNGDFIAIRIDASNQRHLVRCKDITSVASPNDWDSTATSAGQGGATVFQEGPAFPAAASPAGIGIVQASGGHIDPTFYIGDTDHLWKWNRSSGRTNWGLPLVPAPGGPSKAIRFYVDPYRPKRVYLIDSDHAWLSVDGGTTWTRDGNLEAALTENGTFPMVTPSFLSETGRTPYEAQLQDFAFHPDEPLTMFAAGPAGVFMTTDGVNWSVLASAAALNTRVMSLFLDTISDPTTRILYVATPYRGLLKITLERTAISATAATGFAIAKALLFTVFRTQPYPDPFVASTKLQKALTDAITAKGGDPAHNQKLLKTRDPAATDFANIFPIPFTIADVTPPGPFPVAHYNGDEVDFIASEAKVMVLFAALELRTMVRRFAQDLGFNSASDAPILVTALDSLAPKILNAVPLVKDAAHVQGGRVKMGDKQKSPNDLPRLPKYADILAFDQTNGGLDIDFKGAIAPATAARKKAKKYDFGSALYEMIVNNDNDAATYCINAIGYGFLNGALEAGGFFERPTPADPKTFRGLWVGGNYAVEAIRGEISVNDGPAQFGGTTRQIAKLFALIRAGTFADRDDPNGDLASFLLSKASSPGAAFPPALRDVTGGAFDYVANLAGQAQLGRGDPSRNWVQSEGALIKAQRAGGPIHFYAVAWQNLEMRKRADGTFDVVTQGTHKLYLQADVAEIIKNTIDVWQT